MLYGSLENDVEPVISEEFFPEHEAISIRLGRKL